MTIHKAKGLEFPYVIFPYAEKVGLYRESSYWRSPRTKDTSLEGKVEGEYYVQLSSTSSDTLFWKDYEDERRMQAVDNINIFYVALTRPIYGLKVIAKPLPQNYTGPKNMSHVLYLFTKSTQYSRGELFNFKEMERKEAESALIESGYPSFPAESGSRLKFSREAADYFGPDGTVGPEASRRIRGNVLHNILSMVRVPEDLPSAVRAAVLSGELPESLGEEALEFLKERIASVAGRGWFSSRAQIRLEETVLSTDGEAPRPDRVVIHPDGKVDVVDYKFGKEESGYLAQVREYVDLYRRMGFEKVEGYLWYLADNLINFVADKN